VKLTPDSLAPHLERQLLPAYLVSGDEALLINEATDAIRASAKSKGFTERESHFVERAGDWEDVRASTGSMSLFGSRRLVEIRMHSGKPGVTGNKALVKLLEANDPDLVLMIMTPRLDRDAQSADWVKALDARGGWVQVWPIDSDRLMAWLRGRCRRLNLDVGDEALELLADRVEGNLLAAHQELEKLRLLTPAGAKVSADAVLASVADSARFDVFQLTEATLSGDTSRALRVLSGLRSEGVEPTLVLWSLIKAVRDTWNAYAAPPGQGPRVWQQRQAAALEKAARRAPRLSFLQLTTRAERADRMIKGRLSGNPWDEIALLAADLCASPAVLAPTVVK